MARLLPTSPGCCNHCRPGQPDSVAELVGISRAGHQQGRASAGQGFTAASPPSLHFTGFTGGKIHITASAVVQDPSLA